MSADLNEADMERLRGAWNRSQSGPDRVSFYKELNTIIDERDGAGLDRETRFWYRHAEKINGNDPTETSNIFIREATRQGLRLDNQLDPFNSDGQIQNISNDIASLVFSDIENGKTIPPIERLLQADISTALKSGGQTPGGWGGSFYYWNLPRETMTPSGERVMRTVGESITSDPRDYEKFFAANAYATRAVYEKFGTIRTVGEGISTARSAQVPLPYQQEIAHRALFGDPEQGSANNIDGYSFTSGQ